MATKRAKKKTAKKQASRPSRKSATRTTKRRSWFGRFLLLSAIAVAILAGVYYFGSLEMRARMERIALATLNAPRTHAAMPAPLARLLDIPYDWIPSSTGLVVEGGELGREPDSHFLAGTPYSRQALRPLAQPSYTNLFDERALQAACIALRLKADAHEKAKTPEMPQVDARAPRLTASSMTLGQWQPQPIAPTTALIRQFGSRGASDAALATNFAPATASFASGPWEKAMRELTLRYPQRFGEVWVYLGPLYRPDSAKLATGVALPDAFYAIALDLTEAGGLRALALLIPLNAESQNLNDYLTSIAQIEKLSGLQFLPELDFSLRDTLGNYVSPSVW